MRVQEGSGLAPGLVAVTCLSSSVGLSKMTLSWSICMSTLSETISIWAAYLSCIMWRSWPNLSLFTVSFIVMAIRVISTKRRVGASQLNLFVAPRNAFAALYYIDGLSLVCFPSCYKANSKKRFKSASQHSKRDNCVCDSSLTAWAGMVSPLSPYAVVSVYQGCATRNLRSTAVALTPKGYNAQYVSWG